MTIFGDKTVSTLTLADVKKNIEQRNRLLKETAKNQHLLIFNTIWENPKFTPKEIITSFVTDAFDLFQFSSDLQDLFAKADPNYVRLVPSSKYVITINQDGSVDIADA